MTYIRLDDGFADHPKIARLSATAVCLFVTGLCYCSRHTTDGVLSEASVRKLGRAPQKAVDELVHAGLWEPRQDGGYDVHDYLKHQRSKAQIETSRASARDRWHRANFAQPSREVRANRVGSETEGRGQREGPSGPSARAPAAAPAPPGDDDPPPTLFGDSADPATRCYRAWQNQSPGGLNRVVQDNIDGLLSSGVPAPLIEEACRIAGESGGNKPWKYVESIVRRLREGRAAPSADNGITLIDDAIRETLARRKGRTA